MTKINNLPLGSRNNPRVLQLYIVARLCDGEWWYWGQWDDHREGYHAAYEVGGEVFLRSEILAG